MTWPTVAVNTTNVDSGTDNPANARADILDALQKLNQVIGHVATFPATILDDADAPAMRSTLGLGALAVKSTVATADHDNDSVTYAKMQNVSATDKVLGRSTAGAGDPEEIACTAQGRAILDDASAMAQRETVGIIVKRKTADESVTSSTAFQDDDHLTFAVGANEEWTATFRVSAGDTLNAGGVKVAVTVPGGSTFEAFATSGFARGRTTTSGAEIIGAVAVTSVDYILVSVWILNGATPGSVTLQWAQKSSNATPTVFHKGSHLTATRIA